MLKKDKTLNRREPFSLYKYKNTIKQIVNKWQETKTELLKKELS